jgi:hypothetical protein
MYEGRGGESADACGAQRSGLRGDEARRDEGAGDTARGAVMYEGRGGETAERSRGATEGVAAMRRGAMKAREYRLRSGYV